MSIQKHTLVVGGTRGVGRALVTALAAHGQAVSVIGRRTPEDRDSRLATVRHYTVDLKHEEPLQNVLTELLARHGKLSSLVFCQRFRGEEEPWAGELAISLTATKNLIDRLADSFDPAGDKSIVVVSSSAGNFIASEQPLSYHVGKAALNQLVRYYAVVLGPKGIRVNAVSPGTTLKDESKEFYRANEALRQLYESIIPLGRMGTAEELANVIAFLCSAQASFITGQNLVVDGGVSLHWHESLARQLRPLQNIKVTR